MKLIKKLICVLILLTSTLLYSTNINLNEKFTGYYTDFAFTWNYGVNACKEKGEDYSLDIKQYMSSTLFYGHRNRIKTETKNKTMEAMTQLKWNFTLKLPEKTNVIKQSHTVTVSIFRNHQWGPLKDPENKETLEKNAWIGLKIPSYNDITSQFPRYLNYGPVDKSIPKFYKDAGYSDDDFKWGQIDEGLDRNNIQYRNDFWRYIALPNKYKGLSPFYAVYIRVIPSMLNNNKSLIVNFNGAHGYLSIND